MIDYLQPDFYRFNEDSLRLVNRILAEKKAVDSILDLGAGCGVMGIELSRALKPKTLTFVEAQSEYLDYQRKNCELFLPNETEVEMINQAFSKWTPVRQYDLIVSNPPYFLPGHGERNLDLRKEMARSFVIDNWQILTGKMNESLASTGKAFLVVRNDQRIIQEIQKDLALDMKIQEDKKLLFIELSRLNKN